MKHVTYMKYSVCVQQCLFIIFNWINAFYGSMKIALCRCCSMQMHQSTVCNHKMKFSLFKGRWKIMFYSMFTAWTNEYVMKIAMSMAQDFWFSLFWDFSELKFMDGFIVCIACLFELSNNFGFYDFWTDFTIKASWSTRNLLKWT